MAGVTGETESELKKIVTGEAVRKREKGGGVRRVRRIQD